MLVLTRKVGQKVIINNDIEIIVLETRGDSVKIGINAPRNVTIFREEIYEEIRRSNQESRQPVQAKDLDQAFNLIDNQQKKNH